LFCGVPWDARRVHGVYLSNDGSRNTTTESPTNCQRTFRFARAAEMEKKGMEGNYYLPGDVPHLRWMLAAIFSVTVPTSPE